MRKINQIESELLPKLKELVNYAQSKDVEITIDAEEQDRLSLSLHIIEKLAYEKISETGQGLELHFRRMEKDHLMSFIG